MSEVPPFSTFTTVPTVDTLEQHIMMDQQLGMLEKQQIMQQLARELGSISKSTPLAQVVGKLGGGVLGWLIAKYFKMGIVGQAISTFAGYGIGKQIGNFYDLLTKPVEVPRLSPGPYSAW